MEFDKKVPLKCIQNFNFPSLASLPEVYEIQYILSGTTVTSIQIQLILPYFHSTLSSAQYVARMFCAVLLGTSLS